MKLLLVLLLFTLFGIYQGISKQRREEARNKAAQLASQEVGPFILKGKE